MKSVTQKSIGFTIKVNGVPETAEEFDQLAKKEGACVEAATNHIMMHSHLGKFRSALAEKLEEVTGIKRKTKTIGEGADAKEVVDETEAKYIGRLEGQLAEQGRDLYSEFAATAQEVADKIEFDVTPGRTPGAGQKPAKKYLAYYAKLKEEDKLEAFAERYGIVLSENEEENVLTVTSKIREVLLEKERQLAQQMLSLE